MFSQIARFGPDGKRSWEISIHNHPCVNKADLTGAVLSPQAWAWLEANCSGPYKVQPGRARVYIFFETQRDAALFMTFNAGHFDED